MEAPLHPGLPVVGNSITAARNVLGFFVQLQRTYARVVHVRIGGRNQYVTLLPEDAKHVLQENNRNYGRSPAFIVLKRFLGDGLLTSDGEFWRKQRRLAQPAFHRQKIAMLAETMVQEAAAWTDELSRQDRSRPVDLSQAYMDVTMRIVCKTLFGTDVSGGDALNGLSHALDTLNRLANSSLLQLIKWPPHWPIPRNIRFRRAKGQVDTFIYRFIHERQRTGTRHDDLLDMLMYAEDEDTGTSMPEQQLRDECITIFSAGHETTAVSMAWTTYLLSQHPDILARVCDEVNTVLGAYVPGQLPSASTFRSLAYTMQVIQESMRLYPPAWVMSRLALGDDQLGDYQIPKGDTVIVSPYLLHRNPDHWPDPERFDPDRFLAENEKNRPAYAYLPFGGGPRLCIGNQFALLEMQILLALFVQRFAFRLATTKSIQPDPLITLRPNRAVEVWLEGH